MVIEIALISITELNIKTRAFPIKKPIKRPTMAILKDLKFEEGTGKVNYYIYNYNCVEMKPLQIAKFLL